MSPLPDSERTKADNPKATSARLSNWDLLRSLCMLAVVVVHSGGYLGQIAGVNVGGSASTLAILCDPLFFALSGYFAIRPLKRSYSAYVLRKVQTIAVPVVVYSIALYIYAAWNSGLSLHGYIAYFAQLSSGWWFVITLFPYLLAAPVMHWMLEKLDDSQIRFVAKLALAFTTFGIVYSTASWALRATGHETLAAGLGIVKWFTPTVLVPWSGYTMYFCLGYFFRRLAPTVSAANRKKWIVAGLALWLFDVVAAYFGVDRADPSYPWLFATIAVLLVFDKLEIQSPRLQKVSEWTGRRSFAIYLLQYTTIALVAPFIYDMVLGGGVAALAAPLRLMWWIVMVVGAWALALAVASVVDTTVVRATQAVFGRAVAVVQGRRTRR